MGKAQPVQPGPPSKPLPAQGTGQQKRTPNSAFDAAAGNDIYEPEMVVGVATRWSSDHDQMEWFRYEQAAVQLYDVNHSRKAGDAYRQYQLGLEDWRISEQRVAVLQPVADWTQHMQGTKYPTMPLALPTV